jgi:hypothetical protein
VITIAEGNGCKNKRVGIFILTLPEIKRGDRLLSST